MFRAGRSRSFKELMFRGALSLICCAIAALCVGGALSALAENLGPKAPANDVDRTPCKTINCVLKSKGPRRVRTAMLGRDSFCRTPKGNRPVIIGCHGPAIHFRIFHPTGLVSPWSLVPLARSRNVCLDRWTAEDNYIS